MSLTALLTRDPTLPDAFVQAGGAADGVMCATALPALLRLVRERPVSRAVLDAATLPGGREAEVAVKEIGARFPTVAVIFLACRHADPVSLFRLGRAGRTNLVLLGVEQLRHALPHALKKAAERSATSLVTRVLNAYVPRRELAVVRTAMDGVHLCWSAEDFASAVGLSRPFLSERLKACGLPSAGHLLIWTRLLHAGFWLEDPGRTGESVSRQLEYSSGAAFRRALKVYTGATPGEVVERGGLSFVMDSFLDTCGMARAGADVTAA